MFQRQQVRCGAVQVRGGHRLPYFALIAAGLFALDDARAVVSFSTAISDPAAQATPYYSSISSAIDASLGSWSSYLSGSAALSIEVEITSSVPRAASASVTSGFVESRGGFNVFEQGAAFEIRTGIDPNGSAPDVRLQINPGYLSDELWFDPDPFSRTAAIEPDRTDAVSVFLHELGHAFAFNGWGDLITGALPADYESTWDMLTVFDGSGLFFQGPAAIQAYGGPVPITTGNNFHIGNAAGRGSDLVPDLMNGVRLFRGTRYSISPLDLAMMQDMGVELAPGVLVVPEPEIYLLMLPSLGLLALVVGRRARAKRCRRLVRSFDAMCHMIGPNALCSAEMPSGQRDT
jgi:hypothetical protein